MDIRKKILEKLKGGEIKVSDIVKISGFSRAYVQRFFKELAAEGKIVLLGKANQARYVLAEKSALAGSQKKILEFHRILSNKNLAEDEILAEIKKKSGIFFGLRENITAILNYAFTEMLNNAIEHSRSKKIVVRFSRQENVIKFEVRDFGIGIFKNIMRKRFLKNEMEAIQDLLKGKQTTQPDKHSGEGIFFTSKASDILMISSVNKRLIFNNNLEDVFVHNIKNKEGTAVVFAISEDSGRNLKEIFDLYAGRDYKFAKTKVEIKLYKSGDIYISRSQARRVLAGLERFREITLDFRGLPTIGQAFADEIFRVWQTNHPEIKFKIINGNDNIDLMIKRAIR
jgi:anti-sigma regulatory factor (Ser/Thr protein kinase)